MPNSSEMEHSSGKRLWEQQGLWEWELSGFLAMETQQQAPSPCINHGKSLWLWHYRDELYLDANGQTRKSTSYGNSSYILVAAGGLYEGCGASKNKWEQGKQAFQNCTPLVIRNVATHTCSSNPAASKDSVIHGVLAALWLQIKAYSEHERLQNTENRSHLLNG